MAQQCKYCGQYMAGLVFPCKRATGHEVNDTPPPTGLSTSLDIRVHAFVMRWSPETAGKPIFEDELRELMKAAAEEALSEARHGL